MLSQHNNLVYVCVFPRNAEYLQPCWKSGKLYLPASLAKWGLVVLYVNERDAGHLESVYFVVFIS